MTEVVPPAPDDLMEYTYNTLIHRWLDNFATNIEVIRKGLNLTDIPKRKDEPCICIAAGPSLDRYHHLDMIKKAGWKHPILCCDKKLGGSLKHSIIPYAVASVDGSPLIAEFYKTHLVKKYTSQINGVFSVTVHPSVVKNWKGKTYWFTSMLDLPSLEGTTKINNRSVTFILHVLSNYKGIASGVGNVGSFCWNLGYILECDPIILVGFDFSEQVKDKADAVYFKSLTAMHLRKITKERAPTQAEVVAAMDKVANMHQVEKNPDFNTSYLVNPIWKRYREMLASHIVASKKNTINATGNGCLHTMAIKAPNFKAMPLAECLKKYA